MNITKVIRRNDHRCVFHLLAAIAFSAVLCGCSSEKRAAAKFIPPTYDVYDKMIILMSPDGIGYVDLMSEPLKKAEVIQTFEDGTLKYSVTGGIVGDWYYIVGRNNLHGFVHKSNVVTTPQTIRNRMESYGANFRQQIVAQIIMRPADDKPGAECTLYILDDGKYIGLAIFDDGRDPVTLDYLGRGPLEDENLRPAIARKWNFSWSSYGTYSGFHLKTSERMLERGKHPDDAAWDARFKIAGSQEYEYYDVIKIRKFGQRTPR